MGENDSRDSFGINEEVPTPSSSLDLRNGTETIDLHGLFSEPLTESGSFIVGLEASSLGKLLQAIPIPCLLLDQSLRVVFANEACEKLDTDRPRIRGRNFSSLFKDSDSARLAHSTLKKVLSVRRRHVVECRIGRGKSEAWGRLNFRSLRVSEVRLVLLLVEDLTAERRQLLLTRKHENELRKARDELRNRNEKLRKEIAERVSAEEQLVRIQEQLEMRVQERTTELRRINHQLLDEINVRRRVERALRESEQRFRAIFEDNHVVMLLNDPDTGEILDANPAACRFYGYEREELKGKTMTEISADPTDQASREFQKAVAEECRFFYLKHRLGTDEVRDVEVCSGPITVNRKKILYSIIYDVTERKKAEGAVERARRMEALATMAAGIAHEVRNPLAVASSAVQLLSREQVPTDIRHDLASKAVTGINKASEIIEQLLVLTRPIAEFHTTTLDVIPIIGDAIDVIRDEADNCEVTVFPDCPDAPILVIGNTWLLRQALVNVFLKCLTETPRGGALKVRAGREGQKAAIIIRHTPACLTTEEVDTMFEPFSEGTIGDRMRWELSLTYLIIRKHSGNIDVETGTDGSLTFTITLPDRSSMPSDES